MNKKAFSFVEIIISISILVVLAIVATTATTNIKNNSNNSRVIADLATIKNGFISYSNEGANLADPQGNKNFYTQDWSYAHDRSEAFWVYWKVTENTIEKRYLSIVPLDPRTNQYYSYWVAIDSNQFEIAWVLFNEEWHRAKVEGNYSAENWIYNLIREHNWNNFVIDKWPYLPYNPEERILTARDSEWNVYSTWDEITNSSSTDMEVYFSDGSTSIISPGTTLVLTEMDFPKDNNLVSKVKIFLEAGSIWTQATSLDDESSFDIFTSDTTASVRWTIFAVNSDGTNTEVLVERWEVQVKKNPTLINKDDILIKPSIISNQIETIKNDNSITPIELIQNDPSFTKVKKVDMTNPGSISEPELLDVKNVYFSKTMPAISIDNKFINSWNELQINSIDENSKSCYLEWVEIKSWANRTAYSSNESNDCWAVSTTRTCNDGILEWNPDFKFANCKEPTSCPSHFTETIQWISFDVWWLNLSVWQMQIINSLPQNIANGIRYYRDEINCWLDYTYNHDNSFLEHTVSCQAWYQEWIDPTTNMKICVSQCNWIQINWECVQNTLNDNNWVIYKSASYNNPWDIDMHDWIAKFYGSTIVMNCNWWSWWNCTSSNFTNRGCSNYDKNNSFCETNNWTKALYLNAPPWNDWLKYNIPLDDDSYVIEISVMWKELKRDDGNQYYLFDTWDVALYISNWRLYAKDKTVASRTISFWYSHNQYMSYFYNQFNDNDFYKIIIKIDEEDISMIIKNNDWQTIHQELTDTLDDDKKINYLYVWSNSSKWSLWDWLIDYVTIYRKD